MAEELCTGWFRIVAGAAGKHFFYDAIVYAFYYELSLKHMGALFIYIYIVLLSDNCVVAVVCNVMYVM